MKVQVFSVPPETKGSTSASTGSTSWLASATGGYPVWLVKRSEMMKLSSSPASTMQTTTSAGPIVSGSSAMPKAIQLSVSARIVILMESSPWGSQERTNSVPSSAAALMVCVVRNTSVSPNAASQASLSYASSSSAYCQLTCVVG